MVDAERQVATLIEAGTPVAAWPVSTARRGIGGEEGSFRTPPGWHSIRRRIGEDAAQGAVFVSRQRTGERWCGEARNEDLILTRILTLDGLEDGVNLGPGRDLRSRYIYLHGTNHEDLLGRTASHGCVRLSNRDVTELFERMREGDLVLIAAPTSRVLPDPKGSGRFHYAGLAGSGMSALAQFQAMTGGKASGSDRAFDRGERGGLRAELEALDIAVYPQDGSGVGPDCAALVVSTAVEDHVPDVARARELGVPIVHRSELLAHFVATHRSIAITGTSGKSTVTAMVFEILRGAGLEPSVITGGDLPLLQAQGLPGNAFAGASDLLVVEADESDGTLVRYAPAIGVILNLQRDHRETAEVAAMFATLRARTREMLVVGDAETSISSPGRRSDSASPTGPIFAARRSSSTQHRAISAWRTWPSCCRSPARTMWPMLLPRSPRPASSASSLPTWPSHWQRSEALAGDFRPSARRTASRWSTTSPTTPRRSRQQSGPRG